ncbi:MAG: lipopolysaccharide biosynthesis protein [Armatimonadota bacterium]
MTLLRFLIDGYATWFTLLRRSWHSAAVSVLAQVMAAVVVLLASRGLGPSAFGQVMAIAAFYGWFALVSNYDTGVLLARLFADPALKHEEKTRACATAFWLRLLLSLVALGAALLLLPWGLRELNLSSLWVVALLYAPVFIVSNFKVFLDAIFQYSGLISRWSLSTLVFTALPVLLLLALQFSRVGLTPQRYMLLMLFAVLAGLLLTLILWFSVFGVRVLLRPDFSRIGSLLTAGGGPWIAVFCNVLITFGSQTLVARYLPSRELGLYGVVLSLSTLVAGVGLAVNVPAISDWSRLAAAHDLPAVRRDFRRRQASTTVVLGTAMLLAMLAPGPILHLFYGADYVAAAPLLRVYALNWLLTGLGGWYWHYLFSIGHYHRVAYPNLAIGIPTFILSFLFLQYTKLGVQGVVIATVLGSIAWLLTYEWHFRQIMRREAVEEMKDPLRT